MIHAWRLDAVFEKIRLHFGEEVVRGPPFANCALRLTPPLLRLQAMYFYFFHYYTQWLVPLTVAVAVLYLGLRWASWPIFT